MKAEVAGAPEGPVSMAIDDPTPLPVGATPEPRSVAPTPAAEAPVPAQASAADGAVKSEAPGVAEPASTLPEPPALMEMGSGSVPPSATPVKEEPLSQPSAPAVASSRPSTPLMSGKAKEKSSPAKAAPGLLAWPVRCCLVVLARLQAAVANAVRACSPHVPSCGACKF
jgi:hypothetical protein